jgi:hypothetical protein
MFVKVDKLIALMCLLLHLLVMLHVLLGILFALEQNKTVSFRVFIDIVLVFVVGILQPDDPRLCSLCGMVLV